MPSHSSILRVLSGEAVTPPPIWIMRQAGRYLPEYRALRAKTGSFLEFCYAPELAAEATLQPIRRFGFDAAILFSDIFVVPDALKAKVTFVEGEGPTMEPLISEEDLDRLEMEGFEERLAPVYEAVARVKAGLGAETALLGFCGAPWTLATYAIAGRSTSPDHAPAKLFAREKPETFQRLIDIFVEASIVHLAAQIKAGAQAVQIFDSWAGALETDEDFRRWCLEPMRRIAEGLRAVSPGARIIAFPKGVGSTRTLAVAEALNPQAVGIDWGVDLPFARDRLQPKTAVQGNLDPQRLIAGGRTLDEGVDEILRVLSPRPFIFNLGHGILPETPIPHVEALIARVRGERRGPA